MDALQAAAADAPASPSPELDAQEPPVEIHKPKAVHGWREFFNEIGVIVIGVLIALGAEQVVEAIHWSHEVEAQRLSLNVEAQDNLASVARRQVQQPCVERRLREIGLVLQRHADRQPLGIIGDFANPTRANSSRGTWDIALSGQALAHMSQTERLKFSEIFSAFSEWQRDTNTEAAIWGRLSLLKNVQILNEADWSTLHSAYAEAVNMNEDRRDFASFILVSIGLNALKMKPRLVASNSTYAALDRQICKSYASTVSR